MDHLYSHVRKAVSSVPWLVRFEVMDVVIEVLARRAEGLRWTEAEIADRIAGAERHAGPRRGATTTGSIRVIPVYGILAHRAEFFADTSSSGTSVQAIQSAFRQALADDSIGSILFDIDSPGGQAAGIPELAEEIRAARGVKPMVAVSNTLMASAAYWPFANADEIIVTPSSLTGSIGVVMAHVDETAMEEKLGLKTTLIHAGEHKVETYPQSPLTDEAKAHLQTLVDDLYGMFVQGVATARGVTVGTVKSDFGQGRVLAPKAAVKVGMADRIGTFDDAVARLAQGKVKARGASAEGDIPTAWTITTDAAATTATLALGVPVTEGGVTVPADDPGASSSGEAGAPPEELDEIALERAIAASRRPRSNRAARA